MPTTISAWTFSQARAKIEEAFRSSASRVRTEKWQGMDISKRPEMESHELLNVTINVPLNHEEDLDHWRRDIKPNLPWADDHFEERVCGQPLNPGVQWANWPWGKSADRFRDAAGQFNHSYMERFWPQYAGMTEGGLLDGNHRRPHRGIRHEYGDLKSIVELLAAEPLTRQAWIPLFFPEDTGVADGGRKPCTLGYQFIVRDRALHIYYPLRSCDYVRHYHDDVYLALRLGLWVIDRCRELNPFWGEVTPGHYVMHCTSLHIFANDWLELSKS